MSAVRRTRFSWEEEPLLRLAVHEPRALAQLMLDGARLGDVEAQARLGQLLLDGQGIQRDSALARCWFQIAAQQGHLLALNMLGRCLEWGWGGAVDLPAAAACYRQAAAKGLDWGQYNYANLLTKGRGVAQDMAAALVLYRQAAANGHAKSMNLVGRFYEEGWVVERDVEQAFSWYQQSAQGGDFRGQCSYAALLTQRGRVDEAVDWLRLAIRSATPAFLQKLHEVLLHSNQSAFDPVITQLEQRLASFSPESLAA